MNNIINIITCKKCGLKWTPRKPEPRTCPKCKSYYYNENKKELIKGSGINV
jgi:predicted Zn-ribbon and HTH transcriptional regulator